MVQNGGSIALKGCSVSNCSAPQVLGPKRSKLHMEDCKIANCALGLFVSGGKVDVIISNCDFTCEQFGIHVFHDVVGNIDLVSSTFTCTTDAYKDLDLNFGPKCLVTIDGATVAPAPIKNLLDRARHAVDNCNLEQMRLNKKAGVGPVICFNCKTIEPKLMKYKKCGRCWNVCYCSRACQVL